MYALNLFDLADNDDYLADPRAADLHRSARTALARAGSYLVLAVPVLAGVIWYLALTTGEQVLGWQA